MTTPELMLCLSSVLCSSLSQILIKTSSLIKDITRALTILFIGGSLQLSAILLAIVALRTLQLSQIIPFAALAYFLVPLTSSIIFKERLSTGFWAGTSLIAVGVVIANL